MVKRFPFFASSFRARILLVRLQFRTELSDDFQRLCGGGCVQYVLVEIVQLCASDELQQVFYLVQADKDGLLGFLATEVLFVKFEEDGSGEAHDDGQTGSKQVSDIHTHETKGIEQEQ